MSFRVADPFRRDEALAGAGKGAGRKECGVRTDVGGVGEVDEGNQGRRLGGVEEGNEGGGRVVRFEDGQVGILAKPLAFRLRDGDLSVCGMAPRIEGAYSTAQDDGNEISRLEEFFANIAT